MDKKKRFLSGLIIINITAAAAIILLFLAYKKWDLNTMHSRAGSYIRNSVFHIAREEEEELAAKKEEEAREKNQQEEPGEPALPDEERAAFILENYNGTYEQECTLKDGSVRYRIIVVDQIMGEHLYALIKSTDSEQTWEMVNLHPTGDRMYGAVEMDFENETDGTLCMIYSDMEANCYKKDIYRTRDGGKTYILEAAGEASDWKP